MKVVLIGATGGAGSRILKELISRGHHVRALARDASKLPHGVKAAHDDLSNADRTAEAIRGADAVISAYAPPADGTDQIVGFTRRFFDAVDRAGVSRLLVVGGADGLEVSPGVTAIDSGKVPGPRLSIASRRKRRTPCSALRTLPGRTWPRPRTSSRVLEPAPFAWAGTI